MEFSELYESAIYDSAYRARMVDCPGDAREPLKRLLNSMKQAENAGVPPDAINKAVTWGTQDAQVDTLTL